MNHVRMKRTQTKVNERYRLRYSCAAYGLRRLRAVPVDCAGAWQWQLRLSCCRCRACSKDEWFIPLLVIEQIQMSRGEDCAQTVRRPYLDISQRSLHLASPLRRSA
eukprot:6214566-Pleurochrysis_carterae.AAC.6